VPSDTVVAYDNITVAIPADNVGFNQPHNTVQVQIPSEMYATWFGVGDGLSGPFPAHVPYFICTFSTTTDDSNGAPFIFLFPHGTSSISVHVNSTGVAFLQPPDGGTNSGFPTSDITSQTVSVSIFSNYTPGGPTVTITDLYFAFVDAPELRGISGASARDADAGFLTELATVGVTQIGTGGRGRVMVIG